MRTGMRSAVFVAGACGGSLERERETAGLRGVKLRSVIGRIRSNFGLSPSRCFASPALSPSGGAARGDGRRAELSERAGQKTVGDSQGGGSPLGCDLCLLSVASQKVGASAARAGERKEIDSPREGRVCESKPVVVQPVNCDRRPRAPPPLRAGRRNSSVLVAFPAGGDSLFLRRQARLACRAAPRGWAIGPQGVLLGFSLPSLFFSLPSLFEQHSVLPFRPPKPICVPGGTGQSPCGTVVRTAENR